MKNKKTIIEIQTEMLFQRIDKALSFDPEIKTRSRAEYLLNAGLVFINGRTPKSSYKVKQNDLIEVLFPDKKETSLERLSFKLDILFEDNDIIVINKPSGLVMHPAAGHAQDTLVNALINHTSDLSMKFGEDRPGIVHRLDKDTSGLVVIAKNDFSHEKLSAQFKIRSMHRIYYAICFGRIQKSEGTIQSYLIRSPKDRKKYSSLRNQKKEIIRTKEPIPVSGKWAVTHFKLLKDDPTLSYLQLKLETGRTHQIRVHLSELGHPILGDPIYAKSNDLKKIKNKELINLISAIPRLALHAAELGFTHPRTEELLRFKVDWPEDMRLFIKAINF